MTFVNLAAGDRTYVAQLKVTPDFSSAFAAPTRESRKVIAYDAMRTAENAVADRVSPQLEALKQQGLVDSYEYVAGTGALILNVPDSKAAAAWDAIRGVAQLGTIRRNREIVLSDSVVPATVTVPTATPEYNVAKVNAPAAWAGGVNGTGITVGLIDTGADAAHTALKGHFRGTRADGTVDTSYNWFDALNNRPVPYDDHGHGSHTAGTATGGSTEHVIGVAPGAKFIAAKVFSSSGTSSTATILKGLGWMLAPTDATGQNADPTKAPDVVSNSWGSSNGASTSYRDAIKAFDAAGIVPVFSAGNSGPRAGSIGSPGSYPEVLSIGATDSADVVASFSSRGPSPIKDVDGSDRKPDVTAPGVSVISAKPGGDENQYQAMSGTSMAAPAASGVVALLLSKYPTMTNSQVREAMSKSAVDLGTAGYDYNYGNGRIDAVAALAYADKLMTPPPPAS